MRKFNIVLPALTIALAASPLSAEQASTSTAAANEILVKGQQYEKKIVCKYQQNTGTRFATRVCNTNKVWDEMREEQLRNAREMLNKPTIDISRD